MIKAKEPCEALLESRYVCGRSATRVRDGRPVCKRHAEAENIRWQGDPEEIKTCPTCGGAGTVNFTGWGVNSTDQLCPDCLGDGYIDPRDIPGHTKSSDS